MVELDQFARSPYAVSFSRNGSRFTLVTLHVLYGQRSEDRVPELKEIAGWLAKWGGSTDVWGHDLIALGDFNIDRKNDPLYQAFASTGLMPPGGLNFVPRTIFDDPSLTAPADHRHFYDQIAWFKAGRARLSMPFVNAGMFDFTGGLVPAQSQQQLSWRISDHYPLWCEFRVSRRYRHAAARARRVECSLDAEFSRNWGAISDRRAVARWFGSTGGW